MISSTRAQALSAVAGPMYFHAVGLQPRLDGRKIRVEVLDDVLLDITGERAQLVRIGVGVEEDLRARVVALF